LVWARVTLNLTLILREIRELEEAEEHAHKHTAIKSEDDHSSKILAGKGTEPSIKVENNDKSIQSNKDHDTERIFITLFLGLVIGLIVNDRQ
jgi:hypothetical protein